MSNTQQCNNKQFDITVAWWTTIWSRFWGNLLETGIFYLLWFTINESSVSNYMTHIILTKFPPRIGCWDKLVRSDMSKFSMKTFDFHKWYRFTFERYDFHVAWFTFVLLLIVQSFAFWRVFSRITLKCFSYSRIASFNFIRSCSL